MHSDVLRMLHIMLLCYIVAMSSHDGPDPRHLNSDHVQL